jgi:vacuolar-type H+-ATPase catalytic subunit A/Vma1
MSSENEILQTNIRDYFILLIAEYNNCDLYNGYDKRYRLLERMMSVETRLKTTIGSDVSPNTCANKIDNTLKNIKTLEKKIIEHAKLKYKDTTEERIELYNRIVEIYNNSGGVLHVVYILYYTTYTMYYHITYGTFQSTVEFSSQ